MLVVAIAGKMGGTVLAARMTRQSWRHSVALGALLNTRGLVELIVLNIAYNAGVFSQTLFTMLVVMALVTTMMTTPILNLLGVGEREREERELATADVAVSYTHLDVYKRQGWFGRMASRFLRGWR